MLKVHPFLWFDTQAEDAMNFYCSVFKNSRAGKVTRYTDAMPGKSGQVMTVEFELEGLPITGLNAGPNFQFTEAISFTITTKDQAETDYYWNALTADGGAERDCGWLKDKFGLFWQVTPEALPRLLSDPDRKKADRVMRAMLEMRRIEVDKLELAARG